jgi:cytochrome c oxidase subunit 1
MASVPEIPAAAATAVDRVPVLESLHGWVTTVDHKRLGILYVGFGIAFLAVGGIEAAIVRFQLAVPHNDLVSPQVFNRLMTMHGTTMVFFAGVTTSCP